MLKPVGLVLCLMVRFVGTSEAEAPLSWTLEMSTGSSKVDDGGEKAEFHVDAGLSVAADIGEGELFLAAYRLEPVGAHQHLFDDELEVAIGFNRPFALGAWQLSASSISILDDGEQNEFEIGGIVEFDVPLDPSIEAKFNTTTNEAGLAVSLGTEWQVGAWIVRSRAGVGIVKKPDEESYTFGVVDVAAGYPVAPSVSIGPYLSFGRSDSDGFVRNLINGAPSEQTESGMGVGLRLIIER